MVVLGKAPIAAEMANGLRRRSLRAVAAAATAAASSSVSGGGGAGSSSDISIGTGSGGVGADVAAEAAEMAGPLPVLPTSPVLLRA